MSSDDFTENNNNNATMQRCEERGDCDREMDRKIPQFIIHYVHRGKGRKKKQNAFSSFLRAIKISIFSFVGTFSDWRNVRMIKRFGWLDLNCFNVVLDS